MISLIKRFVWFSERPDFSIISDLVSSSENDDISLFDDLNADCYIMDDSGVIHAIYTYHGGDD